MIVIGSYALSLLGHTLPRPIGDLDLIGSPDDVARIREILGDAIVSERLEWEHHHAAFELKEGMAVPSIELDFEDTLSNRLLREQCVRYADVLGLHLAYPPIELLYLTKRAHANTPIRFHKTMWDLPVLKSLAGEITPSHMAYYEARKAEIRERYQLQRSRVSPAIGAEDLAVIPDLAFYDHADLHDLVAQTPGQPLRQACRHGRDGTAIDIRVFDRLSFEDRKRALREEFMVIAIERFHSRYPDMDMVECYRRAALKTTRDLLPEPIQDFAIDHQTELEEPPFDFVARFRTAQASGKVRTIELPPEPIGERHKAVMDLIRRGEFNTARNLAEDMIRTADYGVDRHGMFLLGLVLSLSGRYANALSYLTKVLEHDRNNAVAWLHVSISAHALGSNERSLMAARRAIALGLRTAPAYWRLGLALETEGRIEEALDAFRKVLEIDPKFAGAVEKISGST